MLVRHRTRNFGRWSGLGAVVHEVVLVVMLGLGLGPLLVGGILAGVHDVGVAKTGEASRLWEGEGSGEEGREGNEGECGCVHCGGFGGVDWMWEELGGR